jgi:trehalose/maltose transport system substrate-binding protein
VLRFRDVRSRTARRLALSLALLAVLGTGCAKHRPAVLRFAGEAGVGAGGQFFEKWVRAWEQQSGFPVEIVATPNSSSERLALFQQYWASGSSDIDVYLIDLIWPGIAAPHLLDLRPYLTSEEIGAFIPSLIDANTVDGKLVALPVWSDIGLLYCRRDLLQKYGYDRAPETWDELATWAARIQEGERPSDPAFHGFVWQGARYEGLTCNALEWFVAFGAGTLLAPDGSVDLHPEAAVAALANARGWIGTISPEGVTTYQEEESRQIWQGGHCAFLRSWPYVFALSQARGSVVRGKTLVAPLPRGPSGRGAAVLGGWQLGVSAKTRYPKQAVDLVKFLTSPMVQTARAIDLGQPPSRSALYKDPNILVADPHFDAIARAMDEAVARPSAAAGDRYNEISTAFFTSVHEVLTGSQTPEDAVRSLTDKIEHTGQRR